LLYVGKQAATFALLWQFITMPLFYFDVREGDHLIRDDEGLWFPDLADAEREAAESAACILRDMPLKNGKPAKVTIEVRDQNHRRIIAASAAIQINRSVEA